MIQASGIDYLSPNEAASRLGISTRRVYALIDDGRLRADRVGGRLIVNRDDVDARLASNAGSGRPFSPRRAWALLLLAAGREPLGLDAPTRSKLRRILRERDLWSMRGRLASRAVRESMRAHPSDLPRIEAEPGVVLTGARHAADAGLALLAPDAPLEIYVDREAADQLVSRYRLAPSASPNIILHVIPNEICTWLSGRLAPLPAIALDIAEDPDARSQQVAREALSHLGLEGHGDRTPRPSWPPRRSSVGLSPDAERWLPVIKRRLVHAFHPHGIILFGSQARGEARPDSDIDLFVILQEVKDRHAATVAMMRRLQDLPVDVDVLVASYAELEQQAAIPGLAVSEALAEGQTLYARS